MLFVVCCLLFVVCCLLSVVCRLSVDSCRRRRRCRRRRSRLCFSFSLSSYSREGLLPLALVRFGDLRVLVASTLRLSGRGLGDTKQNKKMRGTPRGPDETVSGTLNPNWEALSIDFSITDTKDWAKVPLHNGSESKSSPASSPSKRRMNRNGYEASKFSKGSKGMWGLESRL